MKMSDGGKGSSPRPYSVEQKTFDENWDRIFKKDEPVKNDAWGDLDLDSESWDD